MALFDILSRLICMKRLMLPSLEHKVAAMNDVIDMMVSHMEKEKEKAKAS